jgi:hypothetical protein
MIEFPLDFIKVRSCISLFQVTPTIYTLMVDTPFETTVLPILMQSKWKVQVRSELMEDLQ